MQKVSTGRYFEDFSIGQQLVHAVPRTLHGGDISTYISLTGDRSAARVVDGARALARLSARGDARPARVPHRVRQVACRTSRTTRPRTSATPTFGSCARSIRATRCVAESEVIGLREVSSGEAGVVYVRTRGTNQKGQEVLSFVRWVMIPKRDKNAAKGVNQVPQLPAVVTAGSPAGSRGDEPAALRRPRVGDAARRALGRLRGRRAPRSSRRDDDRGSRSRAGDAPLSQQRAGPLRRSSAMASSQVRQAPRLRRSRDQRRDGARRRTVSAPRCGSRRGTAARTSLRRSPATRCARSPRSSRRPRSRAAATSARCACGCNAVKNVAAAELPSVRARCCRAPRSRASCSSSTTGRCCRARTRSSQSVSR